MITVFFTQASQVTDYSSAKTCGTSKFAIWFNALLENGVYWPPSQFESAFFSAILTSEDKTHLLKATDKAFAKVAEIGA